MEALSYGGGSSVDALVRLVVNFCCDHPLAARVCDDLPVLEHEDTIDYPVVSCRATKPAFLGSVSPRRIAAVFEIVLDLFETLFTHKFIVTVRVAQVAAKNDGVHQLARVTLEVASPLDTADTLEAQAVPDLDRRHVGLVHQVKNRVRVAQLGCPIQVGLTHETTDTAVTGGIRHNETGIADVAAATRVVGLDVEGAQTICRPVLAVDNVLGAVDFAEKHNASKVLEPIVGELVELHGIHHGVGVTAFNLVVELIMEIVQQGIGYLMARGKGDNGCHRRAIPQSYMATFDSVRKRRASRVGEGFRSRDAVDGSGRRVVKDSWHLVLETLSLAKPR